MPNPFGPGPGVEKLQAAGITPDSHPLGPWGYEFDCRFYVGAAQKLNPALQHAFVEDSTPPEGGWSVSCTARLQCSLFKMNPSGPPLIS